MKIRTRNHSVPRLPVILLVWALVLQGMGGKAMADIVGVPWTGERGVTESVESLMARERLKTLQGPQQARVKPRLRPDRSGLARNPSAPPAPKAGQDVDVHDSGPFTPQAIGTTFNGVTGPNETGSFPPDTMGAVGPTQFIVAVNGRIRSFSKTTGLADGAVNVGTDTFFSSVMTPVGGSIIGNFTSDPHIRYDRLSGRWFIVMIDVPYIDPSITTVENRIMIAVSSGGTIVNSSSFTFFQFRHDQASTVGDAGAFADYPTPGIDANALYIGDNVFSNSTGSFLGCSGFVVRKSSLTGGGPIVVTAFRGLVSGSSEGPYTPQGVDNYAPAATEGYFIGTSNATFGRLVVRRVSDPGGTPSISSNLLVTVPNTASPITVPHLGNTGGTSGNLDAVDDRLYAAHIRNGRLWTAHNIQVDASGAASSGGGRNGSRWYELQSLDSTPALVQSGTVFDPAASSPKSFWIPSILVSGQGHAAMGFSTAGANNRINAGTVGRLASGALGTMQTPVDYTASTTTYNPPGDSGGFGGRRWGDYSFTSLDPGDDMTMWTIQEYCNGPNTYGTQVVKLLAPPPATPVTCSPSTIPLGQSSVSVVVTGTQVSGSGFFDPGAGFAKRISSSVSGGVVVNSIVVTSPTSVTLNLDTSAVVGGVRDVTITNPDGQGRTGSAILTVGTAPEIAVEQPLGMDIPDAGSMDFGSVGVGTNTSLTFTIKNTGNADLTGLTISEDGANSPDFTVTSNPVAPVVGGSSTTFTVQFTPGALGARAAVLHIASNDSDENPFDISLSGTGLAPEIAIEQPLFTNLSNGGGRFFGRIDVGSSSNLTFAIKNVGTADLTGLTITQDGVASSEFAVTFSPVAPVVAGGITTFTVRFTPSAVGDRTASLHIASNDSDENQFNIALTGIGVAPEIVVEQPSGSNFPDGGSNDFGSVALGSSMSLEFTIKNIGNATLSGLAITKDGINSSDFLVTAKPASVASAGGSTTFTVKFAPGAIGSRTASLHIASNDSNENPFDIKLTGTGLAPDIVVQQPAGSGIADGGVRSYGNVALGSSASLTFSIENTGSSVLTGLAISKDGSAASEFSITSNPVAPVSAGGGTSFTVKFTPAKLGDRIAQIHIASNDPDENPFDITLKGFGTGPEISVEQPLGTNVTDGASKNFGSVQLGANKSLKFTIKNTGNSGLTGLSVTKSGTNPSDFAVTSSPVAPVGVGGSTSFTVRFAPGAIGSRTAAIHISSNDNDENPFDIKLSGVGIAPEIAVKNPDGSELKDGVSTVGFGSQTVSTMVNKTFTIENSGKAMLKNLKIRKDGANAGNFTVTQPLLASLKPGASTTFTVAFEPSVIGARVAALHIVSNDNDENPFDIALKGTGIAPEITVTSSSGGDLKDGVTTVALGSVLVNSRVTRTFTIGNSGNVLLKSLKIRKDGVNSGSFGVTQPLQANLKPGATTTFTVTFKPGAAGTRVAALHIASNDSNENPFDIALTGTGIAPEIEVKGPQGVDLKDGSSLVDFGSLKVNNSVTKTLTIKNPGSALLKNISVSENGANAANFTITQPLVNKLKPGASTTFNVTFTPSTTGKRIAALQIVSNDSNENPFDISLTGTGLSKSAALPASGNAIGLTALLGLDSTSDNRDALLGEEHLKTTTSVEWENGRKFLALEFRKPAGGLKSGHHVEVSANLLDWYSGRNHTTVLQDDAEFLKVRDNTPLSPGIKRFIRLK